MTTSLFSSLFDLGARCCFPRFFRRGVFYEVNFDVKLVPNAWSLQLEMPASIFHNKSDFFRYRLFYVNLTSTRNWRMFLAFPKSPESLPTLFHTNLSPHSPPPAMQEPPDRPMRAAQRLARPVVGCVISEEHLSQTTTTHTASIKKISQRESLNTRNKIDTCRVLIRSAYSKGDACTPACVVCMPWRKIDP